MELTTNSTQTDTGATLALETEKDTNKKASLEKSDSKKNKKPEKQKTVKQKQAKKKPADDGLKPPKKKQKVTKQKVIVYAINIMAILITLVLICMVVFSIQTEQKGGLPSIGNYSLADIMNPNLKLDKSITDTFDPSTKALQFKQARRDIYTAGDMVGFFTYNELNGQPVLHIGTFVKSINNHSLYFIDEVKPDNTVVTYQVARRNVLGRLNRELRSNTAIIWVSNPLFFVYLYVIPIFIMLLLGVVQYFINSTTSKKPALLSSDGGADQKQAKSAEMAALEQNILKGSINNIDNYETDNDIVSYGYDEDGTEKVQVTNYYTSIRIKDGEVYTKIKKFKDTIEDLAQYGATDMDIIRVNLIGNTQFDKVLTVSKKEGSTKLKDLVTLCNSLPGVYCIKKRGTLNWTYKYKQKTFIIIRGNPGDDGYKASIKLYPDAADKINRVFFALEESNFPSGPLWFMFNDLRNTPKSVIKWMVEESYRIAQLQQVKSDLIKDSKSLDDLGMDTSHLKSELDSGAKYIPFGKFIITSMGVTADDLLTTYLESPDNDYASDDYNKEFYFPTNDPTFAYSILAEKGATENMINALTYEFADIIKTTKQITDTPARKKVEQPARFVRKSQQK